MPHPVPELLSPAGTLDAVRAALANGANAVYLGAERFNARDDGAQLTLDEVGEACRLAHARGARVYLTFNILFKPAELRDALAHLGACVDRGIDAAIVQDLGAVRLIQRVFPGLEIHGSTQMTVHDGSGARVLHALGVDRVVLARENTLEDIRSIREMAPGLGLESFIHGALCIAYSGQCYMSGMISERSANRGACAQSCRKDYVLTDVATGAELDRGYLISAKDLAAGEHLDAIAEAGIGCLKIEGRKKKPEYVATVTRTYRDFLDRLAAGQWVAPTETEIQPLVQIFSRGFTGGMYGGRAGREYITRDQPDNRGAVLGHVTGHEGRDLLVTVTTPIGIGDGLGFEHPAGAQQGNTGFAVSRVRTVRQKGGRLTQAINAGADVPVGWVVVRSAQAELMERARSSFATVERHAPPPRVPLDFTVAGMAGTPLGLTATAGGERVTLESRMPLAAAARRPLDETKLREQLRRLGESPFVLGRLDRSGLADGLFLPVSALNDLRQAAVAELTTRRDWAEERRLAARTRAIEEAVGGVGGRTAGRPERSGCLQFPCRGPAYGRDAHTHRRSLAARGRHRRGGRRGHRGVARPLPAAPDAAGVARPEAGRRARGARHHAAAPHADHRAAGGAEDGGQVAGPGHIARERAPGAGGGAGGGGPGRGGGLRGQLLQPAHRGRAVRAGGTADRAVH